MNCRDFQDLAIEVAFGEAGRTSEFDGHLEACAKCKQEFAKFQFAAAGIESAPQPPAPSLSTERLRAAIEAGTAARRGSWLPRLTLAGAAASLALVAWLGVRGTSPETGQPYLASVVEPKETVRTEPPVVEDSAPKAVVPSEAKATRVAEKPRVRPHVRRRAGGQAKAMAERPSPEISDGLVAVVVSGAEGALNADATLASRDAVPEPSAGLAPPAKVNEAPIIVIQPQGNATEKSSDDIAIGG